MGIADDCQRDSLLQWMDYYEGRVKEYRQKLAEGTAEKDSERYDRERREQERRTREWASQHPFPKMPQCADK